MIAALFRGQIQATRCYSSKSFRASLDGRYVHLPLCRIKPRWPVFCRKRMLTECKDVIQQK